MNRPAAEALGMLTWLFPWPLSAAFLLPSYLLLPAGAGRLFAVDEAKPHDLIANGQFLSAGAVGKLPQGFTLSGDAEFGPLGESARENNGRGVRLFSGQDLNRDGRREGSVATTVKVPPGTEARWYRLRIRGLAQDKFQVDEDDFYLDVEFFRDGGKNSLDHVKKQLFEVVQNERKALLDAGTNKSLGHAAWRSYDLVFHTPFPEVDTVRATVGFGHGKGNGKLSEFWIDEVSLTPCAVPADYKPPAAGGPALRKADAKSMLPLGGRWYFRIATNERRMLPAQINADNADRLYYLSDRLEAPFVDNMTAWRHKGYLDPAGNEVKADELIKDNVVVSFTNTHLVIHSKNLPNHPTSVFPDRTRSLDGNPNYLQEKQSTWYIPLNPKINPQHIPMKDRSNNNNALPRGPIGVAVNGIVFFNPFDHLLNEDAVWRVDRCCGHPSPNYMYHYHKYPVCVKSPWSDDGEGHSPLIGFAFDGFPVYGPYESKGTLAKDDSKNPLNEFNAHEDAERGWHYHVTPGRFPHIIGGYWGVADTHNRQGPPGGGPGRNGPPGNGPPGNGPPRGPRPGGRPPGGFPPGPGQGRPPQ